MAKKTTAIIDIGSNSVKLSVYPEGRTTFVPSKIITTGLGEGLAATGSLSNTAVNRTFDAVLQLYNEAVEQKADKIIIFATEAVRAANNGNAFCSRVYDATGLKIDVLTGEEEATLGFLGAGQGVKGQYTVIDIGGASVEIASDTGVQSLPLGVLRILDAAGNDVDKIREFIKGGLSAADCFVGLCPSRNDEKNSCLCERSEATRLNKERKLISIGGTATILAAMLKGQRKTYNGKKAHGTKLSRKSLQKLIAKILKCPDLCAAYPFLPPRRARIVLHGAILLDALLEYLGVKSVIAGENGLAEGYLIAKIRCAT